MTHALKQIGFRDEAGAYRDAWNETFPANGGGDVAAVAESVVDGLLSGTFPELGDKQLGDVVSFSAAQHETALAVQQEALLDQEPQSADIRSLVAGARLAFDADPELYAKISEKRIGAQQQIVNRAVASMGDKTRIREVESEISSEDDRSAGQALFQRLVRGSDSE